MVADATLIEVIRKDLRKPFEARLMLMDYAANLALLSVEDQEFWKGLDPVEWSPLKPESETENKNIYSFKIKSPEEWEIESGKIQVEKICWKKLGKSLEKIWEKSAGKFGKSL